MNQPDQQFQVWTRGRFLAIVGCLFALQIGLIALFGARAARTIPTLSPSARFQAINVTLSQEQIMSLFFASDPAVFPLPSRHGFSGRAWMNQPPAEFHPTNALKAPLWLALDASRLGTAASVMGDADESMPLKLAPAQVRQLEPLPVFLTPPIIPTQSVFRIDGELAQRLASPAPTLQAWPSASRKLLTNTVVQIAVSGAGDVLVARLLTRCGSVEADGDAVAKAQALRFRPSPGAATDWAQAVFHWQTTFPAVAGGQP
jgi:hypothetical protein